MVSKRLLMRVSISDRAHLASGTLQLACPWGGSPGELIAADAQSGSAEVYDFFAPRQITDDALRGF